MKDSCEANDFAEGVFEDSAKESEAKEQTEDAAKDIDGIQLAWACANAGHEARQQEGQRRHEERQRQGQRRRRQQGQPGGVQLA
eukprot:14851976-Alexandrium_andersonii.AAC.1